MKEIFDSKYKLYLFSSLFFFFIAIITNVLSMSIGKLWMQIAFPLSFFLLTLGYSYHHKINWDVPIVLMILYMVVGYFCLFDYMSGLLIVEALSSGIVANMILRVFYHKEYKELRKEKKNQKEKKKQESIVTTNKPSKIQMVISFIMPPLFIWILEIYYKMCTFGTPNLKIEPMAIIMLIVIIYAFYFLLLSILGSTHRANLIFSILFLILFIVNQMRIFYTSDTLLLTDFLFLQTTGELTNFVDVTFINAINYVLSPTIIVIAIFAWLWMISYQKNIPFRNPKVNIPMAILSLSVIALLFLPIQSLDRKILNKVYDYNKVSDYTISVSNTRYYYKYGVISGMYGKYLESRRYQPDNYNEEELKYKMNNVERIEATWKKPNIIVIFSESFWELSNLKGITFNKDITPNFHNLEKKGKTLEMISPAYGGISANVEFEILTGGSLNYFSKGYIPYMQLYNHSLSNNTPSIIKELNRNGYKTKILNSSSKNMFNCDRVYDFYEVGERTHLYDELDMGGTYVTDKYLTDEIIKYFENKEKEEKTFYFAITMGGHMPYYEERYDNYDFEIEKSDYSEEINGTIKSYAQGIYMADKELGRLYDYINTLEEDTMIVFFGDHLPHLQTKRGKDALFEIDYLNNNYDLQSVYRQFNTRALIVTNYDIEYDETKYISPDLLFTYIMNNMDLELSPYYQWLYTTIDALPSSNYVVSTAKDGTLHYTLGLEGKMKETYELRKKIQYMMFQ